MTTSQGVFDRVDVVDETQEFHGRLDPHRQADFQQLAVISGPQIVVGHSGRRPGDHVDRPHFDRLRHPPLAFVEFARRARGRSFRTSPSDKSSSARRGSGRRAPCGFPAAFRRRPGARRCRHATARSPRNRLCPAISIFFRIGTGRIVLELRQYRKSAIGCLSRMRAQEPRQEQSRLPR